MAFLRNCWYVAAWSHELRDAILARRILGEPVALYRTESGAPAALLDRCPHRLLPLSMGERQGDAIQCGYHGMTFGPDGRCIRIPGQTRIPEQARARSYPVAEHMGMVWIWMGEPARADRSLLFGNIPWGAAGFALNTGPYTHVGARYELLVENLLDPAHVSFVHKSTLGTAAMADIPIEATQSGDVVLVTRWTRDAKAPPILQRFGKWSGNVDRWQYYYWYPPSIAVVDFGAHAPGSGDSDEARQRGVRIYSCHFLTPETPTTTHYFWLQLRNFALDDATVSREITEQFVIAFDEDRAVLAGVEQAEADPRIDLRVKLALDAGSVRMNRTLNRLIAAEQNTSITNNLQQERA